MAWGLEPRLLPLSRLPPLSARPMVGSTLLGALCVFGVLCLLLTSSRVGLPSGRSGAQPRPASAVALPAEAGAARSVEAPGNGSALGAEPFIAPSSVCAMPEFQDGAMQLNITVYVFAWRRMASLQRTIESLQRAEYCSRDIPLRIYVDGGAWPEVVQYVRSVEWVHGEKSVVSYHEQGRSLGIRGMWIHAAQDRLPDQHVLPLEDDIELSPLYYWWLLRATRAYGGIDQLQQIKTQRLVGISLYTPRLNEICYPQAKWLPDKATSSPVFLLQIPCSWGALYFGSVWEEFLRFYHQRVREPFFNFSQEALQQGTGKDREPLGDPHIFIPQSRSNVWPRSWKRFMIDFMYGRGYVMLYPSLRRQRAFSTTYMERGGHSAKDGKEEAIEIGSLRRDVDPLKTVQLQSLDDLSTVARRLHQLPAYDALPVFDVYHQPRALHELVSRGLAFTERVRWWGNFRAREEARPELARKYAELADEWSGVRGGSGTPGGCAIGSLLPVSPLHSATLAESSAGGAGDLGASAIVDAGGDTARLESEPLSAPALAGRRWLVYQPPGGIGEWFVALRSAAGVARALHRTLVVPHLLWSGGVHVPVNFSTVFDLEPLRRLLPDLIEMNDFLNLHLRPSRIVLIHGKDPQTLPARTYFDKVAGWQDIDSVAMSAQNGNAADYLRLYGGCDEPVLALSQLYAAFDGFDSAVDQEWLDWTVLPAVLTDKLEVERKAQLMLELLRQRTGSFSCVHLADIDQATLSAKASGALGADLSQTDETEFDIAQPAATSRRVLSSACEAFDAEALLSSSRLWVRQLLDEGAACSISDEILPVNLRKLPPRDPVFVLGDGQRSLPLALVKQIGERLETGFSNVSRLARAARVEPTTVEWPALEMHICARAKTMLINRYSPLSAILQRRAVLLSRSLAIKPPHEISWRRLDSHSCMALFTKTARFDIVPNRFGILGQFGPERRLQLLTTNLSAVIGPGGRVFPSASIELDVFLSNASHPLLKFEYTKENNYRGINLPVPPPEGGWREMQWFSIVLPIADMHYSYPISTPWEHMDRLELYYANPSPLQPKGDFIRIRNVFLRSTRSYQSNEVLDHTCAHLFHVAPGLPHSTVMTTSGMLNLFTSEQRARDVSRNSSRQDQDSKHVADSKGESDQSEWKSDLRGDIDSGGHDTSSSSKSRRPWLWAFAWIFFLAVMGGVLLIVLKRRGIVILKRNGRQN